MSPLTYASTLIPTAVTVRPHQGSVAVVADQSITASQISHCGECYDYYCDCSITAATLQISDAIVLITDASVLITTVTVLITTVAVGSLQ